MTCPAFNNCLDGCCDRGVNYLKLAGGGPFTLVYRLPCLDISNRRGQVEAHCDMREVSANDRNDSKNLSHRVMG